MKTTEHLNPSTVFFLQLQPNQLLTHQNCLELYSKKLPCLSHLVMHKPKNTIFKFELKYSLLTKS